MAQTSGVADMISALRKIGTVAMTMENSEFVNLILFAFAHKMSGLSYLSLMPIYPESIYYIARTIDAS